MTAATPVDHVVQEHHTATAGQEIHAERDLAAPRELEERALHGIRNGTSKDQAQANFARTGANPLISVIKRKHTSFTERTVETSEDNGQTLPRVAVLPTVQDQPDTALKGPAHGKADHMPQPQVA